MLRRQPLQAESCKLLGIWQPAELPHKARAKSA
jgi:hypothetical protein